MTVQVMKYARELLELEIPSETVGETEAILDELPELLEALSDPTAKIEKKHRVIDRIFPEEIRDFLKLLCDNEVCGDIKDIFKAANSMMPKSKSDVTAELKCVVPPTERQLEGIRRFISAKFGYENVNVKVTEDSSVGSGFVLSVDNSVFDWSREGRMRQLKEKIEKTYEKPAQSMTEIISILKSEIDEFEIEAKDKEIGFVTWAGDGIVNINGIDHAMYGEVVIFDTGTKGMVQEIRRDSIGCILLGDDDNICEGTRVVRTLKKAGIPVGEGYLGRVTNALGAPIDGKGEIAAAQYRPIENDAPGIVDRKSVCVPMETGILSIDSMFPIGRGQRELIIGDRQTGKTSIAIDAILNQKGKNVVCIYVPIGQKASTVAKIVNTLKSNGAMDYTAVIASTASESAAMQYIAPYAGTALAEYFMYSGKDVLIVYDDLSKHAVAYRALSLLLERSPGREAYPGDVFYLHSRLLERSANLRDDLGGSITALPIVETQAGDVSAYIPTNVISITDGQIFLESSLFFSGMRPAVNVGLSVSRVGGAAQTKAMKKAAGSIRIDLAQYREMEIFTQFSSDLDDNTKSRLEYGKTLMELLKQPLCSPLPMYVQVITLCAATHKLFDGIELSRLPQYRKELIKYMNESFPEISEEIKSTGLLTDETTALICKAAEQFREIWNNKSEA